MMNPLDIAMWLFGMVVAAICSVGVYASFFSDSRVAKRRDRLAEQARLASAGRDLRRHAVHAPADEPR